jgi:hypothetical protein
MNIERLVLRCKVTKHHSRLRDLRLASENGCELCKLVYAKGSRHDHDGTSFGNEGSQIYCEAILPTLLTLLMNQPMAMRIRLFTRDGWLDTLDICTVEGMYQHLIESVSSHQPDPVGDYAPR